MKSKYMNPYAAGTMLGLVLLLAMFLSGRGLGASGGIKYCVVSIVGAVDRPHAENSIYYSKYFEEGKNPLNNWLTIEVLGILAGGFLSGAVSKRLKFRIEKSPRISNTRRLIFAFLGGLFFVIQNPLFDHLVHRGLVFHHDLRIDHFFDFFNL